MIKHFSKLLDVSQTILASLAIISAIYAGTIIIPHWHRTVLITQGWYNNSMAMATFYVAYPIALLAIFYICAIIAPLKRIYWPLWLYLPVSIFLLPNNLPIYHGSLYWPGWYYHPETTLTILNTVFMATGLLTLALWLVFPPQRPHEPYNLGIVLNRILRRLYNVIGVLAIILLIMSTWTSIKNWEMNVFFTKHDYQVSHMSAVYITLLLDIVFLLFFALVAWLSLSRKSLGALILMAIFSCFYLPNYLWAYKAAWNWSGWYLFPDMVYGSLDAPFLILGLIALALWFVILLSTPASIPPTHHLENNRN